MIRCVDVHKSYRLGDEDVPALRGLDLEIAEPGFYAVMGQSGSGKSTLLHLMAALDTPDRGTIEVAGRDVGGLSERDAVGYRRREIGIVFQQFNLIPTLTARENVELPGLLGGDDRAELRKRSSELLDRLGLRGRERHRPEALSGGEQQRVAIARALLYQPPVLFADEPTGNLDSATSERLWSLLAEVALEREMTVVMVTHEPAAAAHCRAIHVVRDGRAHGLIETGGLDAGGVAARYQQCLGAA
jgi:putative ABC transport system ATP-binding protein